MKAPPRHSTEREIEVRGPRKGDQHSGGGGHQGGGGKKGRPPSGWEKGDIVRDEAVFESPYPLKAKPGKRKKLLKENAKS